MQFDFDHELNRAGTHSMKYDDDGYFRRLAPSIRLDQDTIRLMLADMDFKCAPAITKAMHRVADHGTFGYTTADSTPEYKTSIISWYDRRFGLKLDREWIIHSNGALEGIGQTIRTFSEPGDGVILCHPVYSKFTRVIKQLERKVANCQLIQPSVGDYQMDWAKFRRVCAPKENKVFVLCSPENPVGRVWRKEELVRMANICRENGVVLVSDEIHSDIVRKGVKHVPIVAAVEDLSNIIMVSGVNKTFNLMGLHCAYSVIPDEALRESFMKDYEAGMPTPFAIAGMIAAYNESEDWVDRLNEYLDESIAFAVAYIKEKLPKAKAYVPQGTYILWVDFSGYSYSSDILQYIVNHKANVAVQRGLSHDPEQGNQYLRLCLTGSKATIREAIDRMAAAFTEYELELNAK